MTPTQKKQPWTKSRAGAGVLTILLVVGVMIARQFGWIGSGTGTTGQQTLPPPREAGTSVRAPVSGGSAIEAAYREKKSNIWVESDGKVVKLLADDDDGEPHQKMLIRIAGASEPTVLIAHSLTAAGRVPAREGDQIRFRGEYIWTEKGGTVHFTHAPKFKRKEPGGWIDFGGKRYE